MKSWLKEYGPYIVIIIVIILVRMYIITPVRVQGPSMDTTLKEGQILLLYKLDKKIKRNDIVVVDKSVMDTEIIKRVIGLPGDTIECINGKIFINNKAYDDKYPSSETKDFKPITLKDDEYYVMGDNRIVSADSRYFGPISKKTIQGKVVFSLYPFNRFGKI